MITHKQLILLQTRGGRGLNDIIMSNGKIGIQMSANKTYYFYELPDDKHINYTVDNYGHITDMNIKAWKSVTKL